MSKWIRKSGRSTMRRRSSVNGNPRFTVLFDDGTQFPTAVDSQVGYLIENPEYNGAVEIVLDGGEIVDIRKAEQA